MLQNGWKKCCNENSQFCRSPSTVHKRNVRPAPNTLTGYPRTNQHVPPPPQRLTVGKQPGSLSMPRIIVLCQHLRLVTDLPRQLHVRQGGPKHGKISREVRFRSGT